MTVMIAQNTAANTREQQPGKRGVYGRDEVPGSIIIPQDAAWAVVDERGGEAQAIAYLTNTELLRVTEELELPDPDQWWSEFLERIRRETDRTVIGA